MSNIEKYTKNKEFYEKIDELFPDGIVDGLKTKNPELYNEAAKIAASEEVNVKSFFEISGYVYLSKTLEEVRRKDESDLLKAFPDRFIKDFNKKNSSLYYQILIHSRVEFDDIGDYLNSLGFKYNIYNTVENTEAIKLELSGLYPDKKVLKLSMKAHNLYSKIYKLAKRQNKSVSKFVEELGFKYIG